MDNRQIIKEAKMLRSDSDNVITKLIETIEELESKVESLEDDVISLNEQIAELEHNTK